VSGPTLTNRLRPCLLDQAGFLFAGDRGLDDIWPDLIQTGNYEYFRDTGPGSRWTYEFQGERNQIDHIPLSPSIKGIVVGRGINPHFPVGRGDG